jgi:dihydroorotate dehydrogenase
MYRILRRILFVLPPETAHYVSMNVLKAFCSIGFIRRFFRYQFSVHDHSLRRNCFGLVFENPVGLGAGFDKNARYIRELETLGFGFVEIGTVTPRPQAGNERPRLFRLPQDKALINRMGFNNDGVNVAAKRLKKWRQENKSSTLIIGGNIGKNKSTPNEEAWKDYGICFRALHPVVDFFVVNVSSPNTPGLRALQEKDSLRKILIHLQAERRAMDSEKPILLKIAPDLSEPEINDVLELAEEIRLDGLVVANTTLSREHLHTAANEISKIGAGGLSGYPLQERATVLVRYIQAKVSGRIPIIASGGIFSAEDAAKRMDSGALLIEIWTAFIYEGPFIVKKICRGVLNH